MMGTAGGQRPAVPGSSSSSEDPAGPRLGRVLVLVPERRVDPDQGLLLLLGELRVPADLAHQIGALALLEDAGPHVEGLGRDLQGPGDLLEDLGRRLPQAALDLAQVRVRDPRQLGELAEREVVDAALVADELAEVPPAVLEVLLHGRRGYATPASDR